MNLFARQRGAPLRLALAAATCVLAHCLVHRAAAFAAPVVRLGGAPAPVYRAAKIPTATTVRTRFLGENCKERTAISTIRNAPPPMASTTNSNDDTSSGRGPAAPTPPANPAGLFDEERRAELFQFLLRDLQVEGVPLLSVDADQVRTLQAALWTTMAELYTSTQDQSSGDTQACLIFADIPMDDLRSFVDDFRALQTQERLMKHLPELQRFHLSLVGKGVGPAILVAVSAPEISDGSDDAFKCTEPMDASNAATAMEVFVDRIAFAADADRRPPIIAYRVCAFSDVCHLMSSFWNCICELQATSVEQLDALMLVLPGGVVGGAKATGIQSDDRRDRARFAAVAELVSRSLCLYKDDDDFELLHFHPTYDRDQIFPVDLPAHGHVPPTSWIRPALQHYSNQAQNGSADEVSAMSEEDLRLLFNHQRRSPVPAVGIMRVSTVEETRENEDPTELDVGGGVKVAVSGVRSIARNMLRVAEIGLETLQLELDKERKIDGE